jgi:hypothetical protein
LPSPKRSVRLPAPRPRTANPKTPRELLDFVVDPERRFISRRTGLVVIADWLKGSELQTELETQVKTKAMEFVAQNKLFPDRDEVLSQLKLLAPIYGGKIGNKVEFRYRQDDSPK